MAASFEDRFWIRVTKSTSCWLWGGATGTHGFGYLRRNYKRVKAHRVAWELTVGLLLPGYVLKNNSCFNKRCVKPTHYVCVPGAGALLADRFWSNVRQLTSNQCWFWTASTCSDGYGHLRVDGHLVGAHRVSWLLAFGRIPDKACVLHRCDNPPCVNPKHLFLGTHQDNTDDKYTKRRGRHFSGSENRNSKLTEEQVLQIRQSLDQGVSRQLLSVRYGVTPQNIYRIEKRLTWKHLGGTSLQSG